MNNVDIELKENLLIHKNRTTTCSLLFLFHKYYLITYGVHVIDWMLAIIESGRRVKKHSAGVPLIYLSL